MPRQGGLAEQSSGTLAGLGYRGRVTEICRLLGSSRMATAVLNAFVSPVSRTPCQEPGTTSPSTTTSSDARLRCLTRIWGTGAYTYDKSGNLIIQNDGRSQTVFFTYHALNRPLFQYDTDANGDRIAK